MRLPRASIDRPILATVLSAIIVLLGALSLQRLPISEYPEVVPPTIVIRATYPGASPDTIAQTVAGPLEQRMTGLRDLLYQSSQSTGDGVMGLTLTFRIGADLQAALVEVQNRIQQAVPRLPEEVRRLGVTAEKVSGDMLMVVHLRSPDGTADMLTLANYARLHVRDRLAAIDGVGDAEVFGAGEYSMRVWLDPERMAARGLAPGDVARAIREQNVQVAAGTLGQQPAPTAFELTLTTQGRLAEQEQFGAIVVGRGDDGQLVRLRDVARLELGGDRYALRSLLDNEPAVAIAIMQAPGGNALATAAEVRATMAELRTSFPPGIDATIVYDPTQFVRASIGAVVTTLLEAIVLVVVVVVLFLQTWRASLIPLVAVPVSLIGTFAVMHAFGFSINALSLFGLVLAIGIVVDDAIVVVENVERNLAKGLPPREATARAMDEVSGPILATALVLCAVFIPTAFVSGLSGRFYQQFALTIAISTAISAFNSLTLSPALAALLLRPHVPGHRAGGRLLGWFFRRFDGAFAAAANGYVALSARMLRRIGIGVALYGGLLVATWLGFSATPTGFVPSQDKGYLVAFARLPDGASLDRTESVVRQMSDLARRHPAVAAAIGFPGLSINGFTNSPNAGIVFVELKPFAQRTGPELSAQAAARALTGAFAAIDDAFVLALPPPPIMGLGTTGGFKLFLQDRGGVGLARLYGTAQEVLAEARTSPLIDPIGTYTLATMGVPKAHIEIDREKAQAQGVPLAGIHDALQGYFGTMYVNDFNRFGRTYQVNLQADARFRLGTADLQRIRVRNGDGGMVPLAAFADVRETAGPERATQYNTFPAIDISAAPAAGVSSDAAQAEMARILARVLPSGVGYEWTDLAYQQRIAGDTALYIFPMCVLLVFLVLAAFYESWSLPLAIVLIVPTCLLPALAGLWWTGGDNDIMAQIGLIVLVGLACKNAILIVEFAREAERRDAMPPVQAALEACRLRLRPILMTSLAFIMGVWPLVTATGAGAELRRASGVAVFAGMIGVTAFGLLLTPVFYVAVRRLAAWRRREAPPTKAGAAVLRPVAPTALLVLALGVPASGEERVLSLRETVALSAASIPVELSALDADVAREIHLGSRWRLLPNASVEASAVRSDPYRQLGDAILPTTPQTTIEARVRVGQALLDAEGWQRLRAAGHRAQAASARHRAAIEAAAREAGIRYIGLAQAQRRRQIREIDLRLADEMLDVARARVAAGAVESLAAMRAQTRRAEAAGDLIRAEAAVEQASFALALALRLEPDLRLRAGDALDRVLPGHEPPNTSAEAIREARRRRPELQAAASDVAATVSDERAEVGARLPRAHAFAEAGRFENGDGDGTDGWAAGVDVTVPLLDGAWHRTRAARAAVSQERLRQVDAERRVELEVRAAIVDIASGEAEVAVAATERQLAETEVAQAKQRFAAGAAGNEDLIDAQRTSARAGDRMIDTQRSLAEAQIRLLHAVGRASELGRAR